MHITVSNCKIKNIRNDKLFFICQLWLSVVSSHIYTHIHTHIYGHDSSLVCLTAIKIIKWFMSRLLSQCKSKDLWAHKMLMIRKCHAHAHIDQIGKLCNTISMKNGNDFLFGREKKNLSPLCRSFRVWGVSLSIFTDFVFYLKKKIKRMTSGICLDKMNGKINRN